MLLFLAFFWMAQAAPSWQDLPPDQWTDEQLNQVFHRSPWSREESGAFGVDGVPDASAASGISGRVHFFLASAEPIRLAEQEMRRRIPRDEDPLLEEYLDFLEDNPDRYLVLAVSVANPQFLTEKRTAEMEEKCVLRLGEREFRMVGHFPPTQWDRHLRMVFPRDLRPGDTELEFRLFLPGVPGPFRTIKFPLRELTYRDKPAL